jgi:hypothetical protein
MNFVELKLTRSEYSSDYGYLISSIDFVGRHLCDIPLEAWAKKYPDVCFPLGELHSLWKDVIPADRPITYLQDVISSLILDLKMGDVDGIIGSSEDFIALGLTLHEFDIVTLSEFESLITPYIIGPGLAAKLQQA